MRSQRSPDEITGFEGGELLENSVSYRPRIVDLQGTLEAKFEELFGSLAWFQPPIANHGSRQTLERFDVTAGHVLDPEDLCTERLNIGRQQLGTRNEAIWRKLSRLQIASPRVPFDSNTSGSAVAVVRLPSPTTATK
jgi:hypothetical protein